MTGFDIDCTGDVVVGDRIQFTESVWQKRRHPRKIGERTIRAVVIRDSYGALKQTHTFSLKIISCNGVMPYAQGKVITRRGYQIYRRGTLRSAWSNEPAREEALAEKHKRGEKARQARRRRAMIFESLEKVATLLLSI